MRTKQFYHVFLASVMLAATAGLMTSCATEDNPGKPTGPSEAVIKEKIVGKWKAVMEDGEERVTNRHAVMTFSADGSMAYSRSYYSDYWGLQIWANKAPFTYTVSGNTIIREGLEENGQMRKTFYEVNAIGNNEMEMTLTGYVLEGKNYSIKKANQFIRVIADYAADIIGMWEVTGMTGEGTYNDDNARLAFLADGTYKYYRKSEAGEWQLVSTRDVEEYFVDGDFVATRWQEKGGEMNYEWWDIDEIKDGQMKWSALRERADGTRFTTTFTWRKVEAPAGVEAVDLGLPSGTKWANMNVGAEKPEDYGMYFAWGETMGYSKGGDWFDWANYKWCKGSETTLTKYCTDSEYGAVDNKAVLDLEDDAAYVNWGSKWRIPTVEEMREMLTSTTLEWTTLNGVVGLKCSADNGNSIFLPAAGTYYNFHSVWGYYWTTTIYESYPVFGYTLEFDEMGVSINFSTRFAGISVRPVLRN